MSKEKSTNKEFEAMYIANMLLILRKLKEYHKIGTPIRYQYNSVCDKLDILRSNIEQQP
jgi:hypothetical protein